MGLIKCPNCNEIIEDNVYVCPKCGFIFNDGTKDKNEEWAEHLIKKDRNKKIINVVLTFIGLALAILFFVLTNVTQKTIVDANGATRNELNGGFFALTILSASLFIITLFNCWILAHHKVMVETFDGYSVALRKTILECFVYVDNKLVEKKTKNYPSDTFMVSLPNNKKVSIILNTNVCTFELLDE